MVGDFDCTLETAAKILLDAARYLEGAAILCGEGNDEPGYYSIKAALVRAIADEISPPGESWPKGDCQLFDLATRARLR